MNENQKRKAQKSKRSHPLLVFIRKLINRSVLNTIVFLCLDPLYQELPEAVLAATENQHSCNDIKDFISNIIPIGEAARANKDLNKTVRTFPFIVVMYEIWRRT